MRRGSEYIVITLCHILLVASNYWLLPLSPGRKYPEGYPCRRLSRVTLSYSVAF